MSVPDLPFALALIPGAVRAWRATVDVQDWRAAAQRVREQGGGLEALWGTDRSGVREELTVHAALSTSAGLVWLSFPLPAGTKDYPDLSDLFPSADRMQRAVYDLLGARAIGARDRRRWLRHGAWPSNEFPLRKHFDAVRRFENAGDDYTFVPVQGDGVHEIPVGPVHAGTIEPGHFRFSVIGERVLRLEERLGYKHKGIEKRFESLGVDQGHRLAGRVSGDSTVAYAWAYSMAAEAAARVTPPQRAVWLRALLLERERVANHVGDLGFICNDAGLAFALAQLSRLKEEMLRLNAQLFGHRYLMDVIAPGGVAHDLDQEGRDAIRHEIAYLRPQLAQIRTLLDEHPGLQDRLMGTGVVTPELAERLGLTGLAGRASGVARDLRVALPHAPYDGLATRLATRRAGDVAARVAVRFEEALHALDLCDSILDRLPPGNVATLFPLPESGGFGVGWVEGWRGPVLLALELGSSGVVARVHAHDPSWQNWPVLEHAVIGNIVPDFPLINKSFNLTYSGVDL